MFIVVQVGIPPYHFFKLIILSSGQIRICLEILNPKKDMNIWLNLIFMNNLITMRQL